MVPPILAASRSTQPPPTTSVPAIGPTSHGAWARGTGRPVVRIHATASRSNGCTAIRSGRAGMAVMLADP